MDDKAAFKWIMFVSALVLLVVVLLNRNVLPNPTFVPFFVKYLPMLHAFLNGTCFVLLICSFYQIKKKNIILHKKLNLITFALSSVFLISYVSYHFFAEETKFPLDNPLRPIYLFVLLTHILLSAIVLPLVLLSFYWGLKNNVVKHKKIVRWAFPMWLYVTFTGVVVYLMISPYYPY